MARRLPSLSRRDERQIVAFRADHPELLLGAGANLLIPRGPVRCSCTCVIWRVTCPCFLVMRSSTELTHTTPANKQAVSGMTVSPSRMRKRKRRRR
jgi:hypothetical protein